ncbi:MAG: haloacid dehalogenase type II [Aestuariivita sp.]|nr:haloacid dehalogenase type II [Aestuariivita sp.]
MTVKTCIFDAYGTLFDVSAAARQLSQESAFPELKFKWKNLADTWRHKQLQYTWLRAITDAHTDFWTVTKDGLDWALESMGLDRDSKLRQRLLDLYWELQAFPEVEEMLLALKKLGKKNAILSNGSPEMLSAAARSANIDHLLDDILSVESVGIFKPSPQVYGLVEKRFSCSKENVLFVSSNGWDAACASGYGFKTAWVNRANEPVDRLPWEPVTIISSLETLPEIANL